MARRTTRASRKLSKNLKRNTIKRKRMKRNNSKKKTKRTKGGFWGRCHNKWEYLKKKYQNTVEVYYPNIDNVHGNFRTSRYDIKIPFRKSYITINNMRISDMKKLYEEIKDNITLIYPDFEDFTFTQVIVGSEENCRKRFKEVNDFFNYIKLVINSRDSPEIKVALENYGVVFPDVQPEEETGLMEIERLIIELERWYDRVEYSRLPRSGMKKSVIKVALQRKFPDESRVSDENLRGKKKEYIVKLFKDLYMGLVPSRSRRGDYSEKRYELEYWFDVL